MVNIVTITLRVFFSQYCSSIPSADPSVYSNLLWVHGLGVYAGELQCFKPAIFFLRKNLVLFFFLRVVYSLFVYTPTFLRKQNRTSREGKIGHLSLHARRANHLITAGFCGMLCINKRMFFVQCFLNCSSSLQAYAPLIQLTCIDSPHSDFGIREIFACAIRNPGKYCLQNPKSWALESGMQVKESVIPLTIGIHNRSSSDKNWNPVLGIRNPRLEIQSPRLSQTPSQRASVLHCEVKNSAVKARNCSFLCYSAGLRVLFFPSYPPNTREKRPPLAVNKPVDELFASVISNKYKDASDDKNNHNPNFSRSSC